MIAIPEEVFERLVKIEKAATVFLDIDTTMGAPVKWAELTVAIENLKGALKNATG